MYNDISYSLMCNTPEYAGVRPLGWICIVLFCYLDFV